jgi:membrane associated rhomboid family serine protease
MNVYLVCAILGVLAVVAFGRGWTKSGFAALVLFGVMLATTAIGPNLQHGVSTGVDSAITTVKSFFN